MLLCKLALLVNNGSEGNQVGLPLLLPLPVSLACLNTGLLASDLICPSRREALPPATAVRWETLSKSGKLG